ncbi:galactose oxidase [Flagelloscypha sp. PMI_526]|nr:galactose oxidase [Flagelloscypha sp. PMI_526]
MQRDWEEAHKVTEEVAITPSRRANATLTPCPVGSHLWCIGGEYFSDDKKAHFYNDVFRYSPEKNEWRKFISPTCPGPRSAHAVAASAAGGGKLFLFGGEFSSLSQTNFFHYRDFWVFDIQTHSWDRIDTKVLPTARSGHRMAVWKHFIFLFGGFNDPGIKTKYLDDLWIFDTLEYRWVQVEFKPNETRPSARSGFSFLSTPDGIVLHGGYCKEYQKGKRDIGIMLEDTWFLNLSLSSGSEQPATPTSAKLQTPKVLSTAKGKSKTTASAVLPAGLTLKWERKKRASTAYAPAARVGATMTAWVNKSMGIMFGGVTDEDTNEETLESKFWNDMNAYQWGGKGKWVSMSLKKPKKKGAGGKKQPQQNKQKVMLEKTKWDGQPDDDDDEGSDIEDISQEPEPEPEPVKKQPILLVDLAKQTGENNNEDIEPDDPSLSVPSPRYNAMLAVLKNTLYIFGGIYERGAREYTLDDFFSIPLDKMDRYQCLKESEIIFGEGEESSDEEDDDDDDEDDEDEDEEDADGSDENEGEQPIASSSQLIGEEADEEEEEPVEDKDIRKKATEYMGISADTSARSEEEILSTPLPGEALNAFYARSKQHWASKAANATDNRGKMLRRDGFELAKERYEEYKPLLREIEKILAEAGLDEEEMKRSAQAGQGGSGQSGGRYRR